ncbi:MAG: twin-arginine translocase TatA/TatE family subunit [Flavobacteriaceae bacterium]|jgi:sec-independent protein translocase protein TatA|nr:MAG: twin-arginine translocase TatA/TatE family subunit [Flavobacteriaceae bacterium TMED220]|tara:strand:- start:132 stop:407 length:276 start_codon:yes stop_codon:yes gene_type:complete
MSMLFISGAEIIFVFFIVLLLFGADKIPSIAKGLAKGINQVKQATNDIKSEIQNTTDIENPTEKIVDEFKDEIDQVKDGFDEMTDSVKRKF